MIWRIAYLAVAVWFVWWIGRLLYAAWSQGYVMARTKPFDFGSAETHQTRTDNPQKFWANVIVGIVVLPIALGNLFFCASDLWAVIQQQGK